MTGSSNRFLAYWSTGDNFRDAQNRAETRLAAQGTQALPDNSPCEEKTRKKNADFSRLLWEFFFCIFFWGGIYLPGKKHKAILSALAEFQVKKKSRPGSG